MIYISLDNINPDNGRIVSNSPANPVEYEVGVGYGNNKTVNEVKQLYLVADNTVSSKDDYPFGTLIDNFDILKYTDIKLTVLNQREKISNLMLSLNNSSRFNPSIQFDDIDVSSGNVVIKPFFAIIKVDNMGNVIQGRHILSNIIINANVDYDIIKT